MPGAAFASDSLDYLFGRSRQRLDIGIGANTVQNFLEVTSTDPCGGLLLAIFMIWS
jgi:hypothetical protein